MNILITDLVDDLFIDLLKENNIKYKYDTTTSYEEVLRQIHLFDGLVVRNRLKIDANFLNKAKNLKFIGRYGSGMESIDIGKASELNIQCFNSAADSSSCGACKFISSPSKSALYGFVSATFIRNVFPFFITRTI